MPCDPEPVMPQLRHALMQRRCLCLCRAVGKCLRLIAPPKAGQVRTNYGETLRKLRCHLEPGGMRSRMPMKKEDGKSGAAMSHTDLATRCRHELFRETFKKAFHRPPFNQPNLCFQRHYASPKIVKSRVVELTNVGGPEVLELVEKQLPSPGAGEVLIRHTAIGFNFIDTYKRAGMCPRV